MKLRLFSVNTDSVALNLIIKAKISATFRPFSDSGSFFTELPSFQELLHPLSQALAENKLVGIFTALGDYSEIKASLIQALHLKTEQRMDIAEKILAAYPEADAAGAEVRRHSEFPINADVFSGADGTYSGFCCRCGKQYILLMPFDSERTVTLVRNEITSVLAGINGKLLPKDDISCFTDLCTVMQNANITTGVASTAASDFIRRPIEKTGCNENLFRFSRRQLPGGDENPAKYAARLAVNAARDSSSLYGIAMTNIYKIVKDELPAMLICTAVSHNGANADVNCLQSKPGDDVENFLCTAANELFSMLKLKVENDFPDAALADVDAAEFETF